MLRIRLEGCGQSKEIGKVPSLRIESGSLRTLHGSELAQYADGYWRCSDGDFISVVVDQRCQVHFEDTSDRTEPVGPFERLRASGGTIWGTDPRRNHLLAQYTEADGHWRSALDQRRPWPTIVVSLVKDSPANG